jgi:hypothetical protein
MAFFVPLDRGIYVLPPEDLFRASGHIFKRSYFRPEQLCEVGAIILKGTETAGERAKWLG